MNIQTPHYNIHSSFLIHISHCKSIILYLYCSTHFCIVVRQLMHRHTSMCTSFVCFVTTTHRYLSMYHFQLFPVVDDSSECKELLLYTLTTLCTLLFQNPSELFHIVVYFNTVLYTILHTLLQLSRPHFVNTSFYSLFSSLAVHHSHVYQ